MSCYAGHEWGSGVPIQGKYHSKWAKYSLKIGEIELIYARSAFKMFSKHKSMPGALHERSLPRGSLGDIDRSDMLASKVQMLEQIARDSVASGRENNAIGAIRLLAELTGFGVDQKR